MPIVNDNKALCVGENVPEDLRIQPKAEAWLLSRLLMLRPTKAFKLAAAMGPQTVKAAEKMASKQMLAAEKDPLDICRDQLPKLSTNELAQLIRDAGAIHKSRMEKRAERKAAAKAAQEEEEDPVLSFAPPPAPYNPQV